jgi:hypothetical protein
MSSDLPDSPLGTVPDEVITHDDAMPWIRARLRVEALYSAMASEPDLGARRVLVRDAMIDLGRELEILTTPDSTTVVLLCALTRSVLP